MVLRVKQLRSPQYKTGLRDIFTFYKKDAL